MELTEEGLGVLHAERRQREGWLARAIAEGFSPEEQAILADAVELLRRLAES